MIYISFYTGVEESASNIKVNCEFISGGGSFSVTTYDDPAFPPNPAMYAPAVEATAVMPDAPFSIVFHVSLINGDSLEGGCQNSADIGPCPQFQIINENNYSIIEHQSPGPNVPGPGEWWVGIFDSTNLYCNTIGAYGSGYGMSCSDPGSYFGLQAVGLDFQGGGIDNVYPFAFDYFAPVCWTATGLRYDGRCWRDSGPLRPPSKLMVPQDVRPDSVILVEDGSLVPKRRYKVVQA